MPRDVPDGAPPSQLSTTLSASAHLLLLFGEGVHARRKGNAQALYAACEQGSLPCVEALL